jgi:hypothetical protein
MPKVEMIEPKRTSEERLAAARARAQRQARAVNSVVRAPAAKSGRPTTMGGVSTPKVEQSSCSGSHTSTEAHGIVTSPTPMGELRARILRRQW